MQHIFSITISRGKRNQMNEDLIFPQSALCPLPLQHKDHIILGHGSGGKLTHDLISQVFMPALGNPTLKQGDDAARVILPSGMQLAVSVDAHVVAPLFFPGGDIGRLAVCGTVNDVAMLGAQPLFLTASFVLEKDWRSPFSDG